MRKIGLGVMGLAQLYVQLGIKYGSDEGNEVASQLMTHINHGAKATSHELARRARLLQRLERVQIRQPDGVPRVVRAPDRGIRR